MEVVKQIGSLNKKQLKAIQQMQIVDTAKQLALPMVNNPAMQLLGFCLAVEAFQKINFDFKRTMVIPTLDGDRVIQVSNPQPLINANLGGVLEGSAMLTSLISNLGNSKIIEQLIGSSSGGGLSGILGGLLPFLLTKGAA